MLRRKPTRIELKEEDAEELTPAYRQQLQEQLRQNSFDQQQQQQQQQQQVDGNLDAKVQDPSPNATRASRIGLAK
jgi:F0F1-type ATP synthase membrane subunit b/b'